MTRLQSYDQFAPDVELNGDGKSRKRRQGARPVCAVLTNFRQEELTTADGKQTITIGLPLSSITEDLLQTTGGWPKRVGDLLFTRGPVDQPVWLLTTEDLFAWVGGRLPLKGMTNPISWSKGADRVSKGEFHAFLRQGADEFAAVETLPHWPEMPRHYYMHPRLQGGDGKALRDLLRRFKPLTEVDGDLILAFFLTLFWGGQPGQRPAWLVTTDDERDPQKGRGSGKSTLAKTGAYLAGGLIQASPKDEMGKLITRLLTVSARGLRVVSIDNIKSLKFSWGELEGTITSDTISGHQMYAGEGQRPNTLVWCLTVNGASLSRDMAQRTVPIKIARPDYSATWEEETRALIDGSRWAIIGDCIGILKAKAKKLARYSRWAAWEAGVLAHVGEPSECQLVIAERQDSMDDDKAESDMVRDAFIEELRRRGHDPEHEVIWIPSSDAGPIVNAATGEKRPNNKANTFLGTLSINELRKSDRAIGKGWLWWGKDTMPEAQSTRINPAAL